MQHKFDALLESWRLAKELSLKAKPAISAELEARKKLAAAIPKPVEGANKISMPKGTLTFTNNYDRTIDAVQLAAMHERFAEAGIDLDSLVVNVPKLLLTEYRKLTPAQRKLFDRALTIKPATPVLFFEENN